MAVRCRTVMSMRATPRLLAAARVAAVISASGGGVMALHRLGERPYFHIDWSGLGGWLAVTAPEDALVAGVRVLALGLAWWVLGSTVLYVAARATRLPAALRAVEWATLPAVRRLADRAVAVTLASSTVLGAGAPAVAADRDTPAVLSTAAVVQVDDIDGQGAGGTVEVDDDAPAAGGDLPRFGEMVPADPPGLHLPIPEAPAPVSAPPATALPAEPERAQQAGAASGLLEADGGAGDETARQAVAEAGPADDPSAEERAADASPSDHPRERSTAPDRYTVTPGDHLWGIAERTLTAAWGRTPSPGELLGYWRQVLAANASRLASGDPDLIFPGEVIDLPAIPISEE